MGSEHLTSRGSRTLFLGLVLAGAWSYLLFTLQVDWSLGGNSWRQGDWLIHGLAEPVRRGPFGTALLTLADVLRVSPLALLIAFQVLVVTLIFGSVGVAAIKLGVPDKLLLVLFSPAFFFLFWFNDPQGAVRKEMLVYLAFVPLMVAARWRHASSWAMGLAILIFGGAVFAHEGNVFFLPFFWLALWLVLPARLAVAWRVVLLSLPALLSLGSGLYALAHPLVADTAPICTHLVQRGLSPSVCDGAISYLSTTPAEGRMHPGRLLTTEFRSFLLIYAACLLAFRMLFSGAPKSDLGFLAAVFSGLAFLPLYLLGGDYGRWLSFHVSALVLVLLVYFLRARPEWLFRPLARLDFFCVLALYLVVGVSHSPGEFIDGFLVNLARGVSKII